MDQILSNIRDHFETEDDGQAHDILGLPSEYPAMTGNYNGMFGVLIKVPDDVSILEKFSGCQIRTSRMKIGRESGNYLMLMSDRKDNKYEFAALCREFVDPGEDGENRKKLLENPIVWWEKWKELLGNSISTRKITALYAELCELLELQKRSKNPVWSGPDSASHDIQTEKFDVEVKSTLKRYDAEIVVSGQHQLKAGKPLYLAFYRLEEDLDGTSVEELRETLEKEGYNIARTDRQLAKMGYELGESALKKKIRVLSRNLYFVGDDFPKITEDMFPEKSFPAGIKKISYTVDLNAVKPLSEDDEYNVSSV
jgi:hypothetical protein